jgi:hypothetical protein
VTNNFTNNGDFHTIAGIFHMPQICDSFTSPLKEGMLRNFFTLKNPSASPGFEPTNLVTKGQHATPRPLKPL